MSPTIASSPVSSLTSRSTACRGSSPWSRPPPGRVHSSSVVMCGESRDSRIMSSRRITAYAATRCRFGRLLPGPTSGNPAVEVRGATATDPEPRQACPAAGGPHVGATALRGTVSSPRASARSGAFPPRWAGYHGAYSPGAGRCSGSCWISSSIPVRVAPSSRVQAVRSSPGAAVIGLPKRRSLRRPGSSPDRVPAVDLPAHRVDPVDPPLDDGHDRRTGLPGERRDAGHQRADGVREEMPASGNIPTALPSRSSRRAFR